VKMWALSQSDGSAGVCCVHHYILYLLLFSSALQDAT
jgi:hypothetical protein